MRRRFLTGASHTGRWIPQKFSAVAENGRVSPKITFLRKDTKRETRCYKIVLSQQSLIVGVTMRAHTAARWIELNAGVYSWAACRGEYDTTFTSAIVIRKSAGNKINTLARIYKATCYATQHSVPLEIMKRCMFYNALTAFWIECQAWKCARCNCLLKQSRVLLCSLLFYWHQMEPMFWPLGAHHVPQVKGFRPWERKYATREFSQPNSSFLLYCWKRSHPHPAFVWVIWWERDRNHQLRPQEENDSVQSISHRTPKCMSKVFILLKVIHLGSHKIPTCRL